MPQLSRKQRSQREISPYHRSLRHSYRTPTTNGRDWWAPRRSRRGPYRPQISSAETYSQRAVSPTGPKQYRTVSPSPEVILVRPVTPEVIWVEDIPSPRRTYTRPLKSVIPKKAPPPLGKEYPVQLFTASSRKVRYIASPDRDLTLQLPRETSHMTEELGSLVRQKIARSHSPWSTKLGLRSRSLPSTTLPQPRDGNSHTRSGQARTQRRPVEVPHRQTTPPFLTVLTMKENLIITVCPQRQDERARRTVSIVPLGTSSSPPHY